MFIEFIVHKWKVKCVHPWMSKFLFFHTIYKIIFLCVYYFYVEIEFIVQKMEG